MRKGQRLVRSIKTKAIKLRTPKTRAVGKLRSPRPIVRKPKLKY